ncbi:mce related family protein [Mycolicibacterium hassiacum DSM 44199]|jgi:phospholipid/cholesterol/gamma-HCH transport system substrate-binding protein|uniref:Mce related family protein n=1 Tax=Mycolicibacterium hassiacum (strain DSM 44199 / CIP 105218 / JCM 12690 / 3849) TaxID=1122247 RepID=K5B8Z2_MYCHD|nr:MCE family protein [Mycolicibacterium hassiacum]EKF24543.1 mce related family protein [Mycolicibacterium hassiacum DSM 44199]MDA4084336.1 mammalian cell entry protein [Mycolicibacterium hassiacum DSM 44199]PZN22193.1 MAG: MCE family protein [Mycolicibacterium hassiacum]VCT88984.1 hypothetical protein MHAS_00670 [Mycolicibacterium hassiacum DSM 44199]
MPSRKLRIITAIALSLLLIAGIAVQARFIATQGRTHITAYFDNTNGLYEGDEVRILGVPVGRIVRIEPEPERAKVTFWVNRRYRVPADASAVIVAPQLVTARAIELTPVYTGGPEMRSGTVLGQDRTVVPLEWDDLRQQLEKLTAALQPTEPGGVSSLGAFVQTAAANLRGQGADIRATIKKMSQAFSILGDHSNDIMTSVKNLSVVVSALHDSSTLLRQLNDNLAAVTAALASSPDAIATAIAEMNAVVDDATAFIRDNRDALGEAADRLTSITNAVQESIDDVEQSLHLFPNTLQNFINIYQPAQQGITGALTMQNFANPISFLCGAIQAASRLNSEHSAKLCVQYLAPIIKNRQWNFPPLGANYIVGATARPNEITYSEDWLRPDYRPVPPGQTAPAEPAAQPEPGAPPAPTAAAAPQSGEQPASLQNMMLPGGGS